jgi:hypothetical protein
MCFAVDVVHAGPGWLLSWRPRAGSKSYRFRSCRELPLAEDPLPLPLVVDLQLTFGPPEEVFVVVPVVHEPGAGGKGKP